MHLPLPFMLVGFLLVVFSANAFSQEEKQFSAPELKNSSYIAQYPSGEIGWFKNVENKVCYRNFPKGSPLDTISIAMKFLVTRDGKIHEIHFLSGDKRIERSVRKVLLRSGNWDQALQGGRSVHSYRKLKFHFQFDPIKKKWVFDRNASSYLII